MVAVKHNFAVDTINEIDDDEQFLDGIIFSVQQTLRFQHMFICTMEEFDF